MKNNNQLINWYQKIPKNMIQQYDNPAYQNHQLKIPFRMLICGSSGSGKTTLILEIIHRMTNTYGHITIITRDSNEPLYNFLRSKIHPEQLQIIEGYDNIPELKTLDPDVQHLIVFDDLVLEKNQSKIEEYFIRSRKIAKGVSCIYLTQSYFAVPKVIRLQCNYIILKKLSSIRDLNMIMSDFNLGISREKLLNIYNTATKNKKDFLLIDIDASPEERYRLNFLSIFNL